MLMASVLALAEAIDTKDKYTCEHTILYYALYHEHCYKYNKDEKTQMS